MNRKTSIVLFSICALAALSLAGIWTPGPFESLGLMVGMTTLAFDQPRAYATGDRSEYAMIAADIIYEGAAVGLVAGTGHARPLVGGDKFVGFSESHIDNTLGAAAALRVRTIVRGTVELAVAGAVITDVSQPVYATDDNVFVFSPVGASFIGIARRFVAAGKVTVEFGPEIADPYAAYTMRETLSANKTLDAQDCGKLFWVDTDAFTITLPVIADGLGGCLIVNGGAFGAVAVNISPAAADMILGPDIAGADNKDLINTKATARRGDRAKLDLGDADGYVVHDLVGTWAREA